MTNLPDEDKIKSTEQPDRLEDTQPFWVEPEMETQPAMPRSSAKVLAVGAMCACLVVVLSLIGYYLPAMSLLLSFVVPLPMVVAGLMCGPATGMVSLVAASILLAMFVGPLSAVTIGVRYCLMGLALGVCFRQGYTGGKVFAIVTVVSTLSIAAGTIFSFWLAGIPIMQGIEKMIASVTSVYDVLEGQEQMLALLPPGMGMEEYIAFLKRTTVAILPATFVIYCMLVVWVNYLISQFVLRRMGYRVTPLPSFARWQMPLPILWVAMLGLAFGIAGNYLEMEALANISFNLLYMTIPLFLLCGFSILYYYLQRREIPQVVKTITILFLIIFAAFGFMVLTVLGMFDTVFDWRRLHGNLTGK